MKEFNLHRLMKSCCVKIEDSYYDELFDYLIDADVDLNTLNIDDLVVNGIMYLETEDYVGRDYIFLAVDEAGAYVLR